MSESIRLISEPPLTRLTLTRESYVAICDNDFCAARLLNSMERWHITKLKARDEGRGHNSARQNAGLPASHDEALWVRMGIDSTRDNELSWCRELMFEHGYKAVQRALGLLVDKGYVKRRAHPRLNWDKTPQWLFFPQAVQAAVDAWAGTRSPLDLDSAPDGLTEENTAVEHSVDLPSRNGQDGGDHSAKRPNQRDQKAESTQPKYRSNNTEFLNRSPNTDQTDLAAEAARAPGEREQIESSPEPKTETAATPAQEPHSGNAGSLNEVKALDTVPGAAGGAEPDEDARGADYAIAYSHLWACFADLKAKGKEGILGKRVNEALDAGLTPGEIQAAITWALADEWESKKLTPGSFGGMLTRWQAAHRTTKRPALPAPPARSEDAAPPVQPGKLTRYNL